MLHDLNRSGAICIAACMVVASAAFAADWDDERAARAFIALDTDRSLSLSLEEYRAGLEGKHRDEAEKSFRRFDTDGDGQILHRNLRAQWDDANDYLRKEIYELDPATQGRVMETVYSRLDADGDESLSMDEFSNGLMPDDLDRAAKEFDRTDDNDDAQISRGEFREDWNRFRRCLRSDLFYVEPTSLSFDRQPGNVFAALDADGDNRVTIHEYTQCLREPDGPDAVASFKRTDRNKDGVISRSELESSWDLVVVLIDPTTVRVTEVLGVERQTIVEKQPVTPPRTRVITQRPDVFDRIDADNDGQLTVFEYQRASTAPRAAATRTFYQLDADLNGYVDRAELEEGGADINIEIKVKDN